MNILRIGLLVFILLTGLNINAQDRLYTYTYQSSVLNKGQSELEVWNTYRAGREDFYSRLDNRTEFEIGFGKNLQTAFYLNLTTKTSTKELSTVKFLETENEISFSNEWKLKLLDAVAHPIGLALYAEYGIGSNEYELEAKLIIDKKVSDFNIATNFVYEAEFKPGFDNNIAILDKEVKAELYLALAYSFNPKFHLTLESAYKNVFEDKILHHSALYSGPGISFVQDNYWINFTALPQIKSFKGETNSSLNLNEYEKIQIRLLFSFVL
jgi:hypothetical protein